MIVCSCSAIPSTSATSPKRLTKERNIMRRALYLALLACSAFTAVAQHEPDNQSLPGSRTVMDAHNCYPYYE